MDVVSQLCRSVDFGVVALFSRDLAPANVSDA